MGLDDFTKEPDNSTDDNSTEQQDQNTEEDTQQMTPVKMGAAIREAVNKYDTGVEMVNGEIKGTPEEVAMLFSIVSMDTGKGHPDNMTG